MQIVFQKIDLVAECLEEGGCHCSSIEPRVDEAKNGRAGTKVGEGANSKDL